MQRHPERYFGSQFPRVDLAHNAKIWGGASPTAGLVHNAEKTAAKSKLNTAQKSGRGYRIVAGPEVPEINLQILPDVPSPKANKAFEEYWQKAKRRAARKALIKFKTPPVDIIGGYKFPGAPKIDLSPTPASPITPTGSNGIKADIPIGDGLDIPPFLDRTLWNRGAS